MFLYLVQHGEAEQEKASPVRPLTDKGRNDVRKVSLAVATNMQVNRILHSGKFRALQTAEILEVVLHPPAGIAEADGLSPSDVPAIWAKRLHEMAEDIVLVGHLPHLQRLAGLLLCGEPENKVVEFHQGGICALERSDSGTWSLCWVIIPGLINQ
jgi:phosphohistidine phosphatase